MTWVAVAVGGAAVVGAGANMAQGQASNRAGRQARDFSANQTGQGAARYGNLLYGPQGWNDLGQGNSGTDWDSRNTPEAIAARKRFSQLTGGSLAEQSGQNIALAGDPSNVNAYNAETQRLGGVGQSLYNNLGGMYDNNNRAVMGFQNQGAGQVLGEFDQGAGKLTSSVNQWGKGRDAIIERDASKSLKAANQGSLGRAYASGIGGSTFAAQSQAENARGVGEQVQNAKQVNSDNQIDRQTSLGQGLLNTRTGTAANSQQFGSQLYANRLGQSDQYLTGVAQNNLANEYARSGASSQLADTNRTRELSARDARIGLFNNAGQSSVMNPALGQNTTAYYPGVSSWGQAGLSGSNSLGSIGGMLFAQQGQEQSQNFPQQPGGGYAPKGGSPYGQGGYLFT